jgi:EAL domain-containing protein (putative c-di-GMP-specific phosphodiesterase class I)
MTDAKDEAIVRATIELAHCLALSVVAEGVENDEALTRLQSLGCEYAQGYHISPPVAAEAFCDWVRQWQNREKADVTSQEKVSAQLKS